MEEGKNELIAAAKDIESKMWVNPRSKRVDQNNNDFGFPQPWK
jgi:hypothetical protein